MKHSSETSRVAQKTHVLEGNSKHLGHSSLEGVGLLHSSQPLESLDPYALNK